MSRTVSLPWLAGVLWVAFLAAVLALPALTHSVHLGDDLIRNTIRLALIYWLVAVNLMLGNEWGRLTRLCWTLAWITYLIHLVMAFHYYHAWSHADAVEHTRAVSGVGAGIYVSHVFTLAWSADVLSWWLRPAQYTARSPWLGRILHAFMIFVIFNGTVVYESGPIRWAGSAAFLELAALAVYQAAPTFARRR